eukprot:1564875-Amphidinium_carterae.2
MASGRFIGLFFLALDWIFLRAGIVALHLGASLAVFMDCLSWGLWALWSLLDSAPGTRGTFSSSLSEVDRVEGPAPP